MSTTYTNTTPRALIADFGLSVVHDPSSFPTSPQDPSPTPSSDPSTSPICSPPSRPSSFFKSITRTSRRGEKQQEQQKPVGTPRWMAPEVILGKGLTPPADLYGFGMVGWEVMSVHPTPSTNGDTDIYKGLPLPFAHVQDPAMVCQLIVQGERPGRPLPGQGLQDMMEEDKVWEVVERCWKAEPAARPDFRWIESALGGILKRTRERPRAGSDVKKKRIPSLKMPWRRATVDVVVQGDEAPAPATPVPADDTTESDHRPLPPRPRRPSFIKALASFNMSVLTFSKTLSTGTTSDGMKHFEWLSRRSDASGVFFVPILCIVCNMSQCQYHQMPAKAEAAPRTCRTRPLIPTSHFSSRQPRHSLQSLGRHR